MSVVAATLAALALLITFDGLTGPGGARPRRLLRTLDRLAEESGMAGVSGRRLIVLTAVCLIATFVLVSGMSGSLVLAVAFSLLASSAPIAVARARRARRRQRFREAWPDAIANLIAGVRAGISLPEACTGLASSGPVELNPSFAAFAATYRSSGSFQASLVRLRQVLSDPVGDRVVASLSLAHEVGGTDLVRVLRTLGDFVREDLRVRREIEARWSWTLTAARVAAAAPWIVLVLMSTRPEAARAYNSSTGAAVIAAGAAATIVGYRLMLKAAQLPEERRLGG